MDIVVECCGPAGRWCGADRIELALPAAARVADALERLAQRFPELAARRGQLACAIGDRVVPVNETLTAGTVLSLIPPVSGG
ncbi:MAG: MoaD/ThiS family protein [Gammaproteobacteria bacterium]|nr:MoaD/ThiS family protein [Gammaproteobacteria bacterium]